MKVNLAAIGGLNSADQARVVLYQSNQMVHAPLTGVQLQPLDGDLTALAGLTGTGIPQRTGTNTWSLIEYETGPWTPTIIGSSTPGTYVYTTQDGWYERIGSTVFVNFSVQVSSVSVAGTGSARIAGLPFAVSSDGENVKNSGAVGRSGSIAVVPSNFGGWVLAALRGDTALAIRYFTTSTADTPSANIGIVGANFVMNGSLRYEV